MKHKFSLIWRVAVALVLVLSFSLVVAVPAMAGTLASVTATPTSSAPGATTTYTIGFTTTTAGDVKTVAMVFDAGFDVSSAALAKKATNIGVGTVSVSGNTVTYTVTASPPPIISATTAVTIKLSSIVNPSTTASYSVLVKTKDADGDLVDKGTATVTIFSPVEVWVDAAVTADGTGTITNGTTLTATGAFANANVGDAVEFISTEEFTTIDTVNSDDAVTLVDVCTNAEGVGFNLINLSGALTGERFRHIGCAVQTVTASTTINVLPGTYKPGYTTTNGAKHFGIAITTNGLTLQSTDGAATTIIDGSNATTPGYDAIYIQADDVTVDGFTIKDSGGWGIEIQPSGGAGDISGVTIENNVITNCSGLAISIGGKGHVFANNTIEDSYCGLYLNAGTTGHTIKNNTITGCTATTIDGGISFAGGIISNNTITGNTITSGAFGGINFHAGYSGTGNVIKNNNIYDNAKGINNASSSYVKAEYNWWGSTVKATILAMMVGTVDYTPWLTAPYGEEVTPVTTISLESGWNLVSLPLIPTSSAITDVLADISSSVTIVQYYSAEVQDWLYYYPGVAESTLSTMEDGLGYWINMSAAATLDVSGTEMPEAPELPHTYSVVEGWNLVGFKSTTPMSCTLYLGNLENAYKAYSVLYGYDAVEGYFSVYPILEHSGNMEPGCGYWLWATEDGTIVPPR